MAKLIYFSESVGIGLPTLMSQTKLMIRHSNFKKKIINPDFTEIRMTSWKDGRTSGKTDDYRERREL